MTYTNFNAKKIKIKGLHQSGLYRGYIVKECLGWHSEPERRGQRIKRRHRMAHPLRVRSLWL